MAPPSKQPRQRDEFDDQARKIRRIRALIAINSRYYPRDPRTDTLRGELNAAKLEQAILRTVAAWPPLTDDQRSKLAALLRPSPRTEGGPAR